MSNLHELAVDLGIEVDKFANRIEEERRKICEAKARFDSQLKQRLQQEEESTKLEADLERILGVCFVQCNGQQPGDLASFNPYLTKTLGEVRVAAQRIRDERMEILTQYKAKLDQFEVLYQRNMMLELFIESWRKNLGEGKTISEIPQLVKNLSEAVAEFYDVPAHKLLEQALQERTLPRQATSPKASVTESAPMVTDETICNVTEIPLSAETPICRPRGDAEPSILCGSKVIANPEFSRLEFDATMTDFEVEQGIYSDEALRRLINSKNTAIVDQDQTL
uniref:Dynein regulatory complex protein 1/2 N-terminal domain-containing protein n=2 Tax=Mesocestoides corti TaxID=53468 RepID=A0A5K3FDR1_MESCO